MTRLWNVFDCERTNAVPMTDLDTILRALDVKLKEDELASVAAQIDPEKEGIIRFEKLLEVMEDKLKDIDTYEDLVEQFKHLDKDGTGYIPNPLFKQYMMTMGMQMTSEEFDKMMDEADPKGEGLVNYDDFA